MPHKQIILLTILSLVTACGGGSGASSASSPTTANNTPTTVASDQTPVTNNVSFSDVTNLEATPSDRQFNYGSDRLQIMEYWPSQNTAKSLFIMVHGGCWSNSYRINQTYPMASAIANRTNYSVLSIEYRAVGDSGGGWPGSYNDIIDALNEVSSLTIYDYETTVLAGHSAGGHLALLAATETNLALSAVIGLAAIVDIEKYSAGDSSCERAAKTFMGGSYQDIPDTYGQANPVGRTLPQNLYLLYGELDNIVPLSHIEGSGLNFSSIESAGHFDWLHPETNAFSYLINLLNTLEQD